MAQIEQGSVPRRTFSPPFRCPGERSRLQRFQDRQQLKVNVALVSRGQLTLHAPRKWIYCLLS
jgi:hypothetical protein